MKRWGAVGLVVAIAPAASAFSVRLSSSATPVHWQESVVPYYIQAVGSDDLTPEEAIGAVEAGFAAWSAAPCGSITFEPQGDVPDPEKVLLVSHVPNGKNEIAWIEDGNWNLGSYVLGVTTPLFKDSGTLYEADIAFNGFNLTFTVDGGGTDLQSVATHEIGHLIGIQHNLSSSGWDPPTMAPTIASKQKSRTLEDDDILAVCYLYPASAEPWFCDGDDLCPQVVANDTSGEEYYAAQFHCEEGACTTPTYSMPQASALGEECQSDANCKAGLYCQPFDDTGVCASYCVTSTPACEDGFVCKPFKNYPEYGACLSEDGVVYKPGEGPLGSCENAYQCGSGKICADTPAGEKKVCTTLCTSGDDTTCPAGQVCWSYGEATGACFPISALPLPPAEEPPPPAEEPPPPAEEPPPPAEEPAPPLTEEPTAPSAEEPPPAAEESTPGTQGGPGGCLAGGACASGLPGFSLALAWLALCRRRRR